MKKYDYIKIKQGELAKIEMDTGIPYEDLRELYIEANKHLGPGFDCMVIPFVKKVVNQAIESNLKLWIIFKLLTQKMLPSDPNWVSEVYELNTDSDI